MIRYWVGRLLNGGNEQMLSVLGKSQPGKPGEYSACKALRAASTGRSISEINLKNYHFYEFFKASGTRFAGHSKYIQ
ncbi:MAG: hypothetical protein WBY47_10020, partial [Desulfobacterales bacterium]